MHAPPRAGPAPDGSRHEALIYGSDDELLEVAVPFLRSGVAAGEPTFLRLRAPQRAAVLDALGGDAGVGVLGDGASQTPLARLRSTHALVEEAASGGRVRLLSEPPDAPWRAQARYEAASSVLLAALPLWRLCPYDGRRTPGPVLADVESTHPFLSTADLEGRANPRYEDPLVFLEDHARRPDLLQARRPDAELSDPSPARAGEVVGAVADGSRLDPEQGDALRLATIALVVNAREHGLPPVLVRAWAVADRVIVTVADGGLGSDDLLAGVLPDRPSPEACSTLYHVREAVSDVAMFWGPDGFTVRLVQRLD